MTTAWHSVISVPQQAAIREMRLTAEATQFHFAKQASTFPLILRNYRTSYEDDYHELPMGGIHPTTWSRCPC